MIDFKKGHVAAVIKSRSSKVLKQIPKKSKIIICKYLDFMEQTMLVMKMNYLKPRNVNF